MRRADELLRVLAEHLLDGSDPGRQTEAFRTRNHLSHLLAGRISLWPAISQHGKASCWIFGLCCREIFMPRDRSKGFWRRLHCDASGAEGGRAYEFLNYE